MLSLSGIDHIVLTVEDIGATVAFYSNVLQMREQRFTPADGSERVALLFGSQKINLHQVGAEFSPNAKQAMAGSADLCLLTENTIADWMLHLANEGILVEEGPVDRTGALGPIQSLYLRDPDGNLIEISSYMA